MTTALTADSLLLKWPFAGSLEPSLPGAGQVSRPRRAADTAVARPGSAVKAGRSAPAPAVASLPDASHAPSQADHPSAGSVALDASQLQPVLNSVGGIHQQAALASPMTRFGVSRRQVIGDVSLVLVWAAIIPAVLWFGHAAGF